MISKRMRRVAIAAVTVALFLNVLPVWIWALLDRKSSASAALFVLLCFPWADTIGVVYGIGVSILFTRSDEVACSARRFFLAVVVQALVPVLLALTAFEGESHAIRPWSVSSAALITSVWATGLLMTIVFARWKRSY